MKNKKQSPQIRELIVYKSLTGEQIEITGYVEEKEADEILKRPARYLIHKTKWLDSDRLVDIGQIDKDQLISRERLYKQSEINQLKTRLERLEQLFNLINSQEPCTLNELLHLSLLGDEQYLRVSSNLQAIIKQLRDK